MFRFPPPAFSLKFRGQTADNRDGSVILINNYECPIEDHVIREFLYSIVRMPGWWGCRRGRCRSSPARAEGLAERLAGLRVSSLENHWVAEAGSGCQPVPDR